MYVSQLHFKSPPDSEIDCIQPYDLLRPRVLALSVHPAVNIDVYYNDTLSRELSSTSRICCSV